MRASRVPSRIYLVFSLVVSIAVATVVASVGQSHAQADLNLQTQTDIISAPFSPRQPQPVEPVENKQATQSTDCSEGSVCPELLPPQSVDVTRKIQQTKVKFTFPFTWTYESNVFRTNTNVHPDTSYGFGGGWTVVTGVEGRPFDLVVLGASSASARYSAFPSQSGDVASLQAFYQYFLGAYRADGTLLFDASGKKVSPGAIPPSGMITIDTIAVGVLNQTNFTPFYSKEKADFFTPQVTLARQNINLGNPNGGCGPDGQSFCYFANLAVTPAQTFSDIATQANASVALSASIGAHVDRTNLTVALASTVTGKAYEYFPGGRQDLLVQIGPSLQYGINNCFNASLSVTYYRNYSSVRAAAWDGVVVQPTLNVIFPVPSSPDKPVSCG
jgi:hypothetical protein